MSSSPSPKPEQIWLMLGEIRGDLKYLVQERSSTNQRLNEIEERVSHKMKDHDDRLDNLEHFRTRWGVLTAALGLVVPTVLAIIAHQLGLV